MSVGIFTPCTHAQVGLSNWSVVCVSQLQIVDHAITLLFALCEHQLMVATEPRVAPLPSGKLKEEGS